MMISCAQISVLTGGEDDVYAPKIDSAKTYPVNGSVNFSGDKLHLRFDEYIVLVKPSDNIIITPRPAVTPEYKAHNKTLEIIFMSPLDVNTTYTVSFNRAVADLTEKNDSVFQYVFSTGSYIDSLSLSGSVTDGFTNLPSADYLVALYPVTDDVVFDSIPFKIKPTYIGQTNSSGKFKLKYLKEGSYFIFAFDDANKNLLLESDEYFSFMEQEQIAVGPQTSEVELKSFISESGECRLENVSFLAPGKLTLSFNIAPDSFNIHTSCELLQLFTGRNDSLEFWLSERPTARMQFFTSMNGEQDTLKPIYKGSDEVKPLSVSSNANAGKLLPGQFLEITFSEPVDSIPAGAIRAMRPDSSFYDVLPERKDLRTWVIADTIQTGRTVLLDSGRIVSIYDNLLQQHVQIPVENYQLSYYGSLIVNANLDVPENAVVYLLNEQKEKVDTLNYASTMTFEKLIPGNYQLCIVIDDDGNGEWTSGSLPERRIPERVIYFDGSIEVKSKWAKEIDWMIAPTNENN